MREGGRGGRSGMGVGGRWHGRVGEERGERKKDERKERKIGGGREVGGSKGRGDEMRC